MGQWAITEGIPFPLGASWNEQDQSYNFALYSKHAERVTLLLYSEADVAQPIFTRELNFLTNKSSRVWHCRIAKSALPPGNVMYYAYSIDGPDSEDGFDIHRFDPDKILLDPFAKAVYFPPTFDRIAAIGPGSNAGRAALGVLPVDSPFDWGTDRRPRHEANLIIYEMHVKGLTAHPSSDLSNETRGTYRGVIQKIPYLKDLGVTAVELMPIHQFDPQENNYWGYMTLNFFTPHHAYAQDNQVREFKEMVCALHEADIEVILDVVYNHTVEAGLAGPIYSYKGIDNSTYYITTGDTADPYADYSGTGNTTHCVNRHVRHLVLESLRYWVTEMHVDGFRFDLASVFARNSDGTIDLDDPPIFGQIAADPDMRGVRLICEPWDVGAYQLGRAFPGVRWRQWNGQFRDDVRKFIKSDANMVPSLMRRIYGSDDLFPDALMDAYHPWQSINYVCSHDGFSLYDQVAYNTKHNEANGHNNTDGTNGNYSWNCGWEGDNGVPPEVVTLRVRQVKNFFCLLMLANGTPMFRMGDEFLQTQSGNNNPYNQDNATNWLNWNRLTEHGDTFRFFKNMIAFRKAHPSICRSRFWRDDIKWYGANGPPDLSYHSRSVAYCLHGASVQDVDIYVMINAWWEPLKFVIQEGQAGGWRRAIDTSLVRPHDVAEAGHEFKLNTMDYTVTPRSVVVLVNG